MKFAKFLRRALFKKEFQWLHLRFNSCFQRSSEQTLVQLSAINTRFSWKKVFAAAKIQKKPPQVFCKRRVSIALVFSCEYCEIFKNTYLEKYLWTAVSKNQYLSDKFTKVRQFLNFIVHLNLWNTERKEGCSCDFILLVNERKNKKRRILIDLTKAVLKRTSNAIFSMKKVNLQPPEVLCKKRCS